MKPETPNILIVDDEPNIHYSFQKMLPGNYNIHSAHSAEEGLRQIEANEIDIVILDIRLAGMNGLEALQRIRQLDGRMPVILITAYGTVNTAINAMKFGAFEYLPKPFDVDKMRDTIEKALGHGKLKHRAVYIPTDNRHDDESGDVIVGSSPAMQEVYKLIGQVAEQDVTVLIRGGSGTGKELVTRAIYQHSKRAQKPFLEVNCPALPDNLLESELFGYEKGAFTGAFDRHLGKFEQVDGGTLFLDEIGEMSSVTQAKVLRVIQHGEFSRIGGTEVIHTDVRLLVATNRNLEDAIQAGLFREDLYYRLNVITIQLPTLRERAEDIPELVNYFVSRASREAGKDIAGIDQACLHRLSHHTWPGNVRQLENCIRRAVVLAKGPTITVDDLELDAGAPVDNTAPVLDVEAALEKIIVEFAAGSSQVELWPVVERLLVKKTLHLTKGNQVQAARILGIHRNTLRNRMERYGITDSD
ncbi:MAG: sigma-54-dependent transcriptional regulator [bacterium]